ncbi:hypothetical protein [Iodobacter sp.]|uniref:hypothetical protein n=1 Tax=Iodobacter sp. TaxID=1915058 RepID=UPI0025F3041D|nr:hypothetical protein [Iodobacter sp.]
MLPSLQINLPLEQWSIPPFLPEQGVLAAWLNKESKTKGKAMAANDIFIRI